MDTFDQTLDTSGLDCPIPVLRARKALESMVSGEVLRVISTDPNAIQDFEAFSRQTGHRLLGASEENGKHVFLFRKL